MVGKSARAARMISVVWIWEGEGGEKERRVNGGKVLRRRSLIAG